MSSHSVCIERLVLSRNSFLLGKCYTLLQSGVDFQWILEAQSMPGDKRTPPVSEFSPGKIEVLMVLGFDWRPEVVLCKVI